MRQLSDTDLQATVLHIFYDIIHPYMDFYKKHEHTKVLKLTTYERMNFFLSWKRVGKRFHLFTSVSPFENYEIDDDDKYMLNYFQDFLAPRNIEKITKWYEQKSNDNFILCSH